MTSTAAVASPAVTARAVVAAAIAAHGATFSPEQLGAAYEAMLSTPERKAGGVFYTPQPAAATISRIALDEALGMVGDEPAELLRIQVIDPSCGAGIFLVEAARRLADAYAVRLGIPGDAASVMPYVILHCVGGIDIDPVAVDLARISLSLATDCVLPPNALYRHVIVGDPLADAWPPAFENTHTAGGRS